MGEAGTVILTVILRWQQQMASSWMLRLLEAGSPLMPPALWWTRGLFPTSWLVPSAGHLPLSPHSTTSICW